MNTITVEQANKLVRDADVGYDYDSKESSAFTDGYIKGVRECLRALCSIERNGPAYVDTSEAHMMQHAIADELGLSLEERKLWNLS